ncbi:hypothetical protein NDU88_006396 [Pleurodeles waltl]|uniref:Secreted protein n=1 Tax=Pleurodeles waltl TaxID=8319 RepID=A0AAV7RPE7_PLEWA|nr:hypothetical protein NDU88_006396 [Pleurodeles waltl]
MGRLSRSMRRMAFLALATECVHSSICGPPHKRTDLERQNLWSDGGELGRQLALLRTEFHQASLAKARQCWQTSTQRVSKLGDKTEKLLYWLVARDILARVVLLIRDRTGSVQEKLQEIAHTFASYYKDLFA